MSDVCPNKKPLLHLAKYPGRYTVGGRQITLGQHQVLSRLYKLN